MPRAEQNWADNGSVRRPNGKAAVLITSYHWLHSNCRPKATEDVLRTYKPMNNNDTDVYAATRQFHGSGNFYIDLIYVVNG